MEKSRVRAGKDQPARAVRARRMPNDRVRIYRWKLIARTGHDEGGAFSEDLEDIASTTFPVHWYWPWMRVIRVFFACRSHVAHMFDFFPCPPVGLSTFLPSSTNLISLERSFGDLYRAGRFSWHFCRSPAIVLWEILLKRLLRQSGYIFLRAEETNSISSRREEMIYCGR